jgi:hypothetical protein
MEGESDKHYSASADCPNKTVSSDVGSFMLLGKTINDGIAEYTWRDNQTREILDGSSASGAPVVEAQFEMLCPATMRKAPSSSDSSAGPGSPPSHTGNFERLHSLARGNMKMEPIGNTNGFAALRNRLTGITISDKNCDGYICESILSGNPITQMDQIRIHLGVIYHCIQDTLRLRGFPYPEFDLTIDVKRDELLKKILGIFSLQSGKEKRTGFQFDRIHVDATWITPSDGELRTGKEPELTIRLSIP